MEPAWEPSDEFKQSMLKLHQSCNDLYWKKAKLMVLCEKFIKDNNITCGEETALRKNLAEKYPEFVYEICKIVGFDERGE